MKKGSVEPIHSEADDKAIALIDSIATQVRTDIDAPGSCLISSFRSARLTT
ncbi:MAG: hypothetical protein KGL35_12840 [Bradyrhizobium sp.]|nr:hypothetical protein [Bradyrhizobium sp.]